MNSDQMIYSHDVIFDESSEAEADHLSSDWTFNFDLSDEILQSICLYTQQSLFSQAIESFSAPRVIDHVEASTAESSAKLLIKLPAGSPIKSRGKQQKAKSKTKTKPTSTPKFTIEFDSNPMPSADEKLNEMLDFLHLNISDEMFFSNYSWKRMPFRALQDVKKDS